MMKTVFIFVKSTTRAMNAWVCLEVLVRSERRLGAAQ